MRRVPSSQGTTRHRQGLLSPPKGYVADPATTVDSIDVSTRALIIAALVTGLVILLAFAAQVLIAL
jgi:hypothetical protein